MTLSEFTGWLREQGCELIPMPDWNNANTLQVLNTKNGRSHFLNTRYTELFDSTIERVCARLGLPLPPDYKNQKHS